MVVVRPHVIPNERISAEDYRDQTAILSLTRPDAAQPLVTQRDGYNAAVAYLSSLSQTGWRSQETNLRRVLRLFNISWNSAHWGSLRFEHLDAIKRRLQRDGFAPNTINATLSALKGTAYRAWRFGQMTAEDYQAIIEVKGVRGLRVRSGRRLVFDELVQLMTVCMEDENEAAGARDALIIALLAGAGLRRGEAVALELADWRAEDDSLHVRGKGERDRTVYFKTGGARQSLRRWLAHRGDAEGALLCPVERSGAVKTIRHLNEQAIYKAIRRRAREAGTRPFAPHDLRRTCATNMLEGGADILAVSRLLGHVSVETTKIYDYRGEDAKQRAARLAILPNIRLRRKRYKRKSKKPRRRGRNY